MRRNREIEDFDEIQTNSSPEKGTPKSKKLQLITANSKEVILGDYPKSHVHLSPRDRFVSQIQAAEQQIADNFPEIVDALIDLAIGRYEIDEETGQRIYAEKPDKQVAIYLVDRIIGKPTFSEAPDTGSLSIANREGKITVEYKNTQTIRSAKPDDEDEDEDEEEDE